MKLTKSASRSAPRLKRTLTRGVTVEPIEVEHLKYLWAAYKMGAMKEIAEGLTPDEFQDVVAQFEDVGFISLVFIAPSRGEHIPVGLGISRIIDNAHNIVNPHLVWFPWASARNKVESAIEYCLLAKRENIKFLAYVRPEEAGFFNHICKYGVLRRFGTFRGFFNNGEDAPMYQTVREK